MYTIGIDIGGTHLRIGLIGDEKKALHVEKVPQKEILTGDSLQSLAAFVKAYIKKHDAWGQVSAVCAGLPATISRDRSTVLNAPNLTGFDGVNVKEALEGALSLPVFLEKDVNVQLYYDLTRFGLLNCDSVAACYVGTGLGCAMYLDGKLLTGHNGVAGELGHIPAWDQPTGCSCGCSNCVEPLAAGKYLSKLQKTDYPGTPLGELFVKHKEDAALLDYVGHLALPIAAVINILDPEAVILGGGVLGMEAFPLSLLEKEIRRHARKPLPEANLHFIYSDNQAENGVIGAGLYARSRVEGEK